MKNIYLVIAAAGVAFTASGAQSHVEMGRFAPNPHFRGLVQSGKPEQNKDRKVKFVRRADANPIWVAGNNTVYYWEDGEWFEGDFYTNSYDNEGRMTRDVNFNGEVTSDTSYKYDEQGRLIESETSYVQADGSLAPSSRNVYHYSEQTPDFVIAQEEYLYQRGNWMQVSSSFKYDVTRNAEGNVIKSVKYRWGISDYEPESSIELEYGADGRPTKILCYELADAEGTLALDATYSELQWKRCDGQIYSDDDLYSIRNGISRGKYISEEFKDDAPVKILAEYPDDRGSFTIQQMTKIEDADLGTIIATSLEEMSVIDDWGSYNDVYQVTYENAGETIDFQGSTEEYHVAWDGLPTLIYYAENVLEDGQIWEYIGQYSRGKFTVDDTYGYPLEYVSEDFIFNDDFYRPARNARTAKAHRAPADDEIKDLGEWQNSTRVVYSNYFDATSAVNGIESDNDAEPEYFNLHGIRVENPSDGIFIRRQGNKSSKVIL